MSFELNTGSQLLNGLDFPVLKIQDFPNRPETSVDWNVAPRGDNYFVITFRDVDENESNNPEAAGSIDTYSSPPAAANDEEFVVNKDNQAQGFNTPVTPESVHVPMKENSSGTFGPDAWKMNGCEDFSKMSESDELSMNLDKSGSNFASMDLKKTFENYLQANSSNKTIMAMNLDDLKTSASFGTLDLQMNSFPKNPASVAMDLNSSDRSAASSSLFIDMTTDCGPEPEPTVLAAGRFGEMLEKPDAGIQFQLIDSAVSQSNPSSSYSEVGESSGCKVGSSSQGKKRKVSGESKRRTKQRIPDQMKDDKYWAMRKRNTESARKCRENKKLRESQSKIDQLLYDNDQLLKEVMANRKSIEDFKEKMLTLGIDLQLL